ncbi:hypothetical protein ACFZAM_20225 [Streptomyces sp. NPDC008079]|uniref:hypothetical protein n=1 Tax=Streptomyces sp. NPDC008079 TaxID=3364806 RepID=UPI0036EB2465
MTRRRTDAVVSGDARFEVLSPTLIRTAYAGDTAFLDAPTFNAVGRDGFGGAPFTQRVLAGVRLTPDRRLRRQGRAHDRAAGRQAHHRALHG